MDGIFMEIKPEEIKDNTFKALASDWMLVTAGTMEKMNTMTASWGGFGVLWDRNVGICVVRPTRYTYDFMEKSDRFTLSFYDASYRNALVICGTKSGRDTDKIALAGLTPMEIEGSVCFKEARLIMVCRKIYYQDVDPANFLDPAIGKSYPKKDYHRMYVGEILKCYAK